MLLAFTQKKIERMGSDDPFFKAWVVSQAYAVYAIYNPVFPVIWCLAAFVLSVMDFPKEIKGIKTTLRLVVLAPFISIAYVIFANTVLPIVYRLVCVPIYERRHREQLALERRDAERRNATRAREAAEREATRLAMEEAKRSERELWEKIQWDVRRMQDERERTGTYFLIQTEGN